MAASNGHCWWTCFHLDNPPNQMGPLSGVQCRSFYVSFELPFQLWFPMRFLQAKSLSGPEFGHISPWLVPLWKRNVILRIFPPPHGIELVQSFMINCQSRSVSACRDALCPAVFSSFSCWAFRQPLCSLEHQNPSWYFHFVNENECPTDSVQQCLQVTVLFSSVSPTIDTLMVSVSNPFVSKSPLARRRTYLL